MCVCVCVCVYSNASGLNSEKSPSILWWQYPWIIAASRDVQNKVGNVHSTQQVWYTPLFSLDVTIHDYCPENTSYFNKLQ